MENSAAIGYMILAARKLGMDEEQIKKLEHGMVRQMDFTGEEEASEAYRNY